MLKIDVIYSYRFDAKYVKKGVTTSISPSILVLILKVGRDPSNFRQLQEPPAHPPCVMSLAVRVQTAEGGVISWAQCGLATGHRSWVSCTFLI